MRGRQEEKITKVSDRSGGMVSERGGRKEDIERKTDPRWTVDRQTDRQTKRRVRITGNFSQNVKV